MDMCFLRTLAWEPTLAWKRELQPPVERDIQVARSEMGSFEGDVSGKRGRTGEDFVRKVQKEKGYI
jgi:hypothetical protein